MALRVKADQDDFPWRGTGAPDPAPADFLADDWRERSLAPIPFDPQYDGPSLPFGSSSEGVASRSDPLGAEDAGHGGGSEFPGDSPPALRPPVLAGERALRPSLRPPRPTSQTQSMQVSPVAVAPPASPETGGDTAIGLRRSTRVRNLA